MFYLSRIFVLRYLEIPVHLMIGSKTSNATKKPFPLNSTTIATRSTFPSGTLNDQPLSFKIFETTFSFQMLEWVQNNCHFAIFLEFFYRLSMQFSLGFLPIFTRWRGECLFSKTILYDQDFLLQIYLSNIVYRAQKGFQNDASQVTVLANPITALGNQPIRG